MKLVVPLKFKNVTAITPEPLTELHFRTVVRVRENKKNWMYKMSYNFMLYIFVFSYGIDCRNTHLD